MYAESSQERISGETNLHMLWRYMEPIRGGEHAFCVLGDESFRRLSTEPLATS